MSTLRLVPASGPPIEIRKDETVVGRDPACDVVVADGSVSRKHARIERRGDIWYAIDQGSANGTFLDSVRVGESPLVPGQELRFGAISYRVEIEGGPPPDLAATLAPEAGATVIQPSPMAPRPPAAAAAPPPPPPPPPPPVTAEVPIPARVAPPPPAGGGSTPRPGAGVRPLSMPPPGARQGRSPAFWIVSGGCGCLLLLVLAVIGVVVLPCGGAFTAMWKATEAPVIEIRAQLQDIKAGQLDAAYARFSASYRASLSRSDFEALVEAHPGLKDNADSTFNQRNVSGDTAEMSGTLKSAAGAVEAVTYQLVKEGGAWKISAVRFAGDASVPPLSSQEDGATTSALAVRNTGLRKEPSAEDVKFMISLLILGVGTRVQGPQREWNLVVDLELLGPNGRPVFGPQSPWKQLTEATREEIASVPFDATLTLPASLEAGTYVARFTFRDQVSGGRRDHDVSLAFP